METSAGTARQEPSAWRERIIFAIVATVGLAISIYLAAYQLGALATPWDPLFGPASSSRVLHSGISRVLPVPDAAVGAAAYLGEIATDLAGGTDRWRTHPWLVLAFAATGAALGLAGLALTAIQVFVVRSGCTLCLCSAAASISVALGVAGGGEIRAALGTISGAGGARRRVRWP